MPRTLTASALAALFVCACSAPRGGVLPLDVETYPAELVEAAHKPASELAVELMEQDGAIGGRIVFGVAGEPEEVLDMLLDFDNADGRRAWSTRHELLSRDGDLATARWHLKGKGGIRPTVRLAFVTERLADRIRLTFDLVERTFGVMELFGDFVIVADERGGSLLAGRVFVASGLPFGGPTVDDIHDGMRVDAELIRDWMHERLLAR